MSRCREFGVGRRTAAGAMTGRSALAVACVALAALLAGCATTSRLPPVPLSLASSAVPLNIGEARYYGDRETERLSALATQAYNRSKAAGLLNANGEPPTRSFLAISGGGDDGAYGAGFLVGWSARGDRPEFGVVTGVSTGALSAPFVFLGPEYDEQLKRVYTETGCRRRLRAAWAHGRGCRGRHDRLGAVAEPDRRLRRRAMIQRLAAEYGKGRLLLILTTNLDQAAPSSGISAPSRRAGNRARAS